MTTVQFILGYCCPFVVVGVCLIRCQAVIACKPLDRRRQKFTAGKKFTAPKRAELQELAFYQVSAACLNLVD